MIIPHGRRSQPSLRGIAILVDRGPAEGPLADVAQLAEHFTRNEGVSGSNPLVGSLICPLRRAFYIAAGLGHRDSGFTARLYGHAVDNVTGARAALDEYRRRQARKAQKRRQGA